MFDIVTQTEGSETQYKKIKNFNRYINDHIKRIAKANELPEDCSFYWARHSFATNSIRKGASMEFISEALNHSDLNVTKNYFAGFEDKAKKEFANSLLDF
ncbi:tyrosine-type recombinase/integrase [Subsaximicrobium wynnwilliamsii]|uniref:tyrosine-type recombinase/integrase n=1 Tax=Subsaximicrobium wynnwilliamsii TaxID=291179 RepID=UPI001679845B|nr:tyrosine-type recombinase/integrase [Subsaximicrobium wynnwilliamsii]